ncbi:E1 protein [Papillomaviridae sp. Seabass_c24797]|nr:E1 protein [Papillomaviridae sp. Seabass_c24797]
MAEFLDLEAECLEKLFDSDEEEHSYIEPEDSGFLDDGFVASTLPTFDVNLPVSQLPRGLAEVIAARERSPLDRNKCTEEISPQFSRISIAGSSQTPCRRNLGSAFESVTTPESSSTQGVNDFARPLLTQHREAFASLGFRRECTLQNTNQSLDSGASLFSSTEEIRGHNGGAAAVQGQPLCADAVSQLPPQGARAVVSRKEEEIGALAKFKEATKLSWHVLVRQIKSSTSKQPCWCALIPGESREVKAKLAVLSQEQNVQTLMEGPTFFDLHMVMIEFFTPIGKDQFQLLCLKYDLKALCINAPNPHKDVAVLVWRNYCAIVKGDLPEWIKAKFQAETTETGLNAEFKLKIAAQYCIDNDINDEAQFIYQYSQITGTDSNAKAWLNHNSCLKWAKDAVQLSIKMRAGREASMNPGEFVQHKIDQLPERTGNFKKIDSLLLFQNIMPVSFANAVRKLLYRVPKKSVLCLVGKKDTGKSLISSTLSQFLGGKALGFQNHRSSFWLQPAINARLVVLDDATLSFWEYANVYLRTAFDGNSISVDAKNLAMKEIKFPPIIITSNYDIRNTEQFGDFGFLTNRVLFFSMQKELTSQQVQRWLPTSADWASWFFEYRQNLDIEDDLQTPETA